MSTFRKAKKIILSKREKSDFLPPKVPFVRQTVVPEPGVKRNYTLDPILFRGRVRSQNHKMSQKAAIMKLAMENADFIRNAQ